MAGVNKVILVGRLGKDPESKTFANGGTVVQFTMATSENWRDKATGERKEKTEWHRVKFTRKLAEIVGEYVRKGQMIYVEGKLETQKYTDKQGIERYSTDVVANEMQMLGGKKEGGDRGGSREDSGWSSGGDKFSTPKPASRAAPAPAAAPQSPPPAHPRHRDPPSRSPHGQSADHPCRASPVTVFRSGRRLPWPQR